jgi:hypothetical protein
MRIHTRILLGILFLFVSTFALANTTWVGLQCGAPGTLSVIPIQHLATGCPSTGSWNQGVLAVGTDGALCYSTAGGSPGTWVEVGSGGGSALNDLSDVTITGAASGEVLRYNGSAWVDASIDGSDVGLADSPSSDGDYVLRRASGSNSWTAASGGGASWTTGTSAGLQTLNTSGVVLATWDLPSGWMSNNAGAELIADVLTISNASSRSVDFRWQFRASDNSPVFFITGSAATGLTTPVAGNAFQLRLDVHVSDVSSGIFFRTASKTYLASSIATSTVYVEAFSSLATAAKIVLLAEQDSGSDTTMTAFRIVGTDTTP